MAFVLGEFIAVMNDTWLLGAIAIVLVLTKIITKQQGTVFVVIFLFSILGFLLTDNEIEKKDYVYRFKEQKIEITGKISRIEEKQYGFCVYLHNSNLNGKILNHFIVYTDCISKFRIGNTVKVSGSLKQFSAAGNEGNFDSKRYYMSFGIYAAVSANQIQITDDSYDAIRQGLYQWKTSVKNRINIICNQNVKGILKVLKNKNSIYSGILLGDKSDMDMELKELYSASGISHILAISGLHISMIGMFLYAGFRRKFCFGVSASVSIIVVVMFGILSGMGVATIRALVMFGLKLFGEVIGRSYDYLTAISLAGIILLMENPFVVFHSGFQMSFAAIVSIVIIWKKIVFILQLEKQEKDKRKPKNKYKYLFARVKKKIILSLLFSLNISIFMSPIVAYHYFSLPTYSFLLNIIVVPFMSIVVISGVLGIAFSYFGAGVARAAIFPGSFVLELYEKMCNMALKLPFANIIVGKPNKIIIVIYYLLIIVVLLFLEHKRKKFLNERNKKLMHFSDKGIRVCDYINIVNYKKGKIMFPVFLILTVIVLNSLLYGYFPFYRMFAQSNQLVITALDVGQGDGIIFQTPNHKVITIDGGSTSVNQVGKYRIIPFFKSQCIRKIDYAVMTHADEDHVSGLIEIMKTSDGIGIEVENLVLPDIQCKDEAYHRMIQTAREHGVKILYITKGKYMKFGDVQMKCVYPDITTQAEDRNDYSTVMDVRYHKFSMLLTGDISSKCEADIEDELQNHYTVLKVAHHGSKYSTSESFLQKINPDYNIISVGKQNLYGHPGKETLKRLSDNGGQILRTDKSGEIKICTNGHTMKISLPCVAH